MSYLIPTNDQFRLTFVRDFPYGASNECVMDSDITKAIAEAGFNFNEGLFSSQEEFTLGYLYLTAHYLVMDLRAGAQGVSGAFDWLGNSKSVGSVSEAFTIPQRILDHPVMSYYSKTYYGAKYLSLLLPRLAGNVSIVCGRTQP